MDFSLKVKVPQVLRPFFPYFLKEELPTQLIIKNDSSKTSHIYSTLAVAMLESLFTLYYPSLFQYCIITLFYSDFLLMFFADEPQEFVVSSLGITQIRRFFFLTFRRLLSRGQFQSIRYTISMSGTERFSGHIILYRIERRPYTMFFLTRATRTQLVEDLEIISEKVSCVLGVPNKPTGFPKPLTKPIPTTS